MNSKEFVHNLVLEYGLLPCPKNHLVKTALMRYNKDSYCYSFVIADRSVKVAAWKFLCNSTNFYYERLVVNLCDPKSIELIKNFVL